MDVEGLLFPRQKKIVLFHDYSSPSNSQLSLDYLLKHTFVMPLCGRMAWQPVELLQERGSCKSILPAPSIGVSTTMCTQTAVAGVSGSVSVCK